MIDPPPADQTLRAASTPSASRSGELVDARTIGHYAVLRKLGEGGMGVVYAAFDEELARRVALKLLHGADQPRLLREAQALARVSHPNVVQIYAVGRYREHVYVAMEYVDGPTLDVWLREAPREPAAILDAFAQAGRGLAAAHESGLVHRDFKPSNVLVGADGRVRVLDFGLARAELDEAEVASASSSGRGASGPHPALDANIALGLEQTFGRDALQHPLTATGALMGTPAYMSPEQHLGVRVDARSDQFSFCVALFEALYARRPFVGDDLTTLSSNVLRGLVVATPSRAGVPASVESAIRRGLSVDPAARWPSMAALLEVLESTIRHERDNSGVRTLVLLGALISTIALITVLSSMLVSDAAPLGSTDLIAFGFVLPVLLLAALPILRRRFPRPDQRRWIRLGLICSPIGLVSRIVTWQADFDVRSMLITETLLYAVAFMVVAHFTRIPSLLVSVVFLVGAIPILDQPGIDLRLFTAAWMVSLPLATVALWRRGAPAPTP